MTKDSSGDFSLPKNFDIDEVTTSSEEEKTAIKAGNVETWERLELNEKAKTRPYIAGIVISLWVICTTIGLFRLATIGDVSLLISSPLLLIGPLNTVIKFYFNG
jgi:hypothetical protein